tara:strand:+ start:1393 stop:1644 length:252 start_codon:yes stop_codon:yes gene_type:complete
MNNIDTNEVEPLLRSSAKDEKRETSRTVKLAALAGCGILAGAAVLGTGHSRDSFRLFGGQRANLRASSLTASTKNTFGSRRNP